jgi:hypothetical protein
LGRKPKTVYRDVVVGLAAVAGVDGVEFRCSATFPRRTIYRRLRVARAAAGNYLVTSVRVAGTETLAEPRPAQLFAEPCEAPSAIW